MNELSSINRRVGKSSLLKSVLWIFVAVTVLKVWFSSPPLLPAAKAQLPNPAKQRLTMLKEAQRTNQLLSDIKALLEGGTLNVRVLGADN